MFSVTQVKENLIGMGHGGTLNKVRNQEALFERAASKFLAKCKPLETMRLGVLASTIHDDLNDYALPSDFNSLIDLMPEDNRTSWDNAFRTAAGKFDLEKAIKNRIVSIEGSEGTKIIRINWKSRSPKLLNSCDSLSDNGTWAIVGTASGLVLDSITKLVGSAAIRFDVAATGDGVQNTSMTAVDMTNEDEVADVLFDVYIKNATDLANINSITAIWGNDLSTKYWTGVAQTAQADGTAFKVGWNSIKVPWSTATETGTVTPSTIDSFKVTINIDAAIGDLRLDNIRFSIGRNFDIKYYSKYLFKSSTTGVYASRFSSDDDWVTIDNDSLPIYLYECLKEMAHQMEGTDSAFDINYAMQELKELYPAFRTEFPDQRKKLTSHYGGMPRWQR